MTRRTRSFARAASSICSGFAQVAAHRLLQVQVPAVAEHFADPLGVEGDRQQDLGRIDLDATRGQLGRRGERARPGQSAWRWARRCGSGSTSATTSTSGLSM